MRQGHQDFKRLVVAVATAVSLVAAPAAAAGPVTTITAAGTAVDVSPLDAFGNDGPCALALSASAAGRGVAGSGSFTASGGTGLQTGESTCAGGATSIRFIVVRAVATNRGGTMLHVRVTASDDPATLGSRGTIDVDEVSETIRVDIARHRGVFESASGDDGNRWIDRRAEVEIAAATVDEVTHFAGTGTAVDVDPDTTQVYADCAVAVAGVRLTPDDPARTADGLFTAMTGQGESGRATHTCLGGVSDFTFALEDVVTDGENAVMARIRVDESDAGPAPGIMGSIAIDEPNQVVSVRVRRHWATFGPGRAAVADVESRAGASVGTHVVGTR